jgi:hypothetical protein
MTPMVPSISHESGRPSGLLAGTPTPYEFGVPTPERSSCGYNQHPAP